MAYGTDKYGDSTYGGAGAPPSSVVSTRWMEAEAKLKSGLSDPTSDSATTTGPGVIAGTDIANTVDLGGGRVLWVFGDTYWPHAAGLTRSGAVGSNGFLHNVVALQTGYDLSTCTWAAYAAPESQLTTQHGSFPYFKSRMIQGQPYWRYPLGGIKLGDKVLCMGMWSRNQPVYKYGHLPTDNNLGTTMCGPWAVMCHNIDAPPNQWVHQEVDWKWPRDSFHLENNFCPASAPVDGGDGYAYMICFGPARHDYYAMCRMSLAKMAKSDLSDTEWFTGTGWKRDAPIPPRLNMAGGTQRYRKKHITFGLNNSDQIGGLHKRPDGKWQLTFIPDWSINRAKPNTGEWPDPPYTGNVAPGNEPWFDSDPRVRYSLANSPSDLFTTHSEIYDIPLDTYDIAYGAYVLPEQTWAGKGANDQLIVYSMNFSDFVGNFTRATRYWPEVIKVTGI